jgi:hypothetical protein
MVAVLVDGSQSEVCSDDDHARLVEAESGFVGWSLCTADCAEFGCDGYLGWTHADWPFPDVVDARAAERPGWTAERAALVRNFKDPRSRRRAGDGDHDPGVVDMHARRT